MLYVVAEPAYSKQKPNGTVQLLKAQLTACLKCLSLMAKEDAQVLASLPARWGGHAWLFRVSLISWSLNRWLKTKTSDWITQKWCTRGGKLPQTVLWSSFCTTLFACVSWDISSVLEVSLLWYSPPAPKPSHVPCLCLHEFAVLQLTITPLTNSYRIPLIPDIARNNFLPLCEGKQPWKFIQST